MGESVEPGTKRSLEEWRHASVMSDICGLPGMSYCWMDMADIVVKSRKAEIKACLLQVGEFERQQG